MLSLYGTDPHTLDPAVSSEMTSHEYIMQIFSGLVTLDENLAPAPDIAERWDMSTNGLTYTFYLRKDVRFQDGRKVTAQDVKYSWSAPATRPPAPPPRPSTWATSPGRPTCSREERRRSAASG